MSRDEEVLSLVRDQQELQCARQRRKHRRLLWKICFVCMVFFYVEIPLPPLPPRLAFPLAMLFTLLTGWFFFRSQQLPLREALLLGRIRNGCLSLSVLCTDLELPIPEAETLLRIMEKRRLIQIDQEALLGDGEMIYRITGL